MTSSDKDIVSALQLSIAEGIGIDRFKVWFRTVEISTSGTNVRIATSNEFTLNWLRTNLRKKIEAACQSVIGQHCLVEFCVDPACQTGQRERPAETGTDHAANAKDADDIAQATAPKGQPAVNGKNTAKRKFKQLATFLAGDSNRVAISSALHVTNHLGSMTPLFLYGATGVGKSHLAEGIWTAVRRSPGNLRTVYLSAEQFTTYFLQALNGSGLPSFRRRYRQVDLLVVEDVQFFTGKRATIVELQHTVDTVLREGRQLVLTADRAPSQLGGLGSEMVNRLTGGLVVRVESPDYDARQDIVQKQANELGLALPDEVVQLIASNITEDVRKLAGAVNRLHAISGAWNQAIDVNLTTEALEEVFRSNVRVVRLADIEDAVCRVFDVTPKHLRSGTRIRRVSHPRMLAMALARKHTRAGLVEIGEYFGRRSHATVISASKKIDRWRSDGQQVRMTDQECSVDEAIRLVERRLLG